MMSILSKENIENLIMLIKGYMAGEMDILTKLLTKTFAKNGIN